MSIRKPILDNNLVKDQKNNIILETTESKIGIKSSSLFASNYASPELAQSIAIDGPVNHLTDIFTFGILVLELITHVIGFKTMINYESFLPLFANLSNHIDIERTNDILQKRLEEFLNTNRSDINPRLKTLIKKCMEVHPSKRYQNFDEILKVINGITKKNLVNNYGKLRYNPSIPSILFYGIRGLSLIEMGFRDKGEITYDYAISLPCISKADHTNKGMILIEKRRYAEAIAEFDAATLIDPTDTTPYINRGSIYTTTSRYMKAISEYNKAIKINSKDYLPHSNRGNAFRHIRNYKEAIHSYDRALLHKPTYIKAIINKIGCLRRMKQFDEAMLLVKRALILDPWDNSIHRLRINIQSDLDHSH